jgi:tRNA G18 (ribose-2'-O)-methylase SpoU
VTTRAPVIEIAGIDDPRIADYAHVGDPSWLRERSLFVAEGRLVVRRLLSVRRFRIRSILVTHAALAALQDVLDPDRGNIYVCNQQTLNAVCGIEFHRGCLAIAEVPQAPIAVDRFADARRLLALEGVGNPDNIGGLFRVAAAFEAAGVVLDSTSADPLYRKAIRTSMGASLQVPFARCDAWLEDLGALRERGFHLVALTPAHSATPLSSYAADLPSDARVILMLGGEGPGLSPAALRAADIRLRIPIAADVDSLNVVVAAGIALAALP